MIEECRRCATETQVGGVVRAPARGIGGIRHSCESRNFEFTDYPVGQQLKLNLEQLRQAIRCALGLDDYIEILKGKDWI